MGAHILVIEDNSASLELMIYLLRAFGHTAQEARDGEEGVEAVRSRPPDLILCDIQLPTVDGYTVARRLKGHPTWQGIPIVAVTALAMVGDREKVLAAGFEGYIPKPINSETFVGQVESFLRSGERSPVPAATPGTVPDRPTRTPRALILVVDNSPVNIDLARCLLEPFGYEVMAAAGMGEAMTLGRQKPPDLILSDVNMSDGLGFDLIQVVKADPRLSAIPFLFITSTFLDVKEQARGMALGADRFLVRPIDPQRLLDEIQACLREGKEKAAWRPS